MALSDTTLEHILEAESHLRASIRAASSCENPVVISQLSKILLDLETVKALENIMDMFDPNNPGASNSFFNK